MRRAGTPRGSSLGVGACTTGLVRGWAGLPPESAGTAQVTDQWGRSRSSTGRSARRSAVRGPCAETVRQRVVPLRVSSRTVKGPSVPRRRVRTSSVSTTTSSRPGRARSRASSTASSSRSARSAAAGSRSGRMTTVSYDSGADPSAAKGSRSSGTCPSLRRISSPSPGLYRAVSAASPRASASDQRTPPCRPTTAGSSVTAITAANPTPNRPTAPSWVSRFAEARRVASDSTPAASSGAPVLAATRTPSRRVSRRRPGTPARAAASAAF